MKTRMTTPPAGSGGNKAIIAIFVLGTVILAVGIAVMVVRNRTDDDAGRTERPVVAPPPPSPSLVTLPPKEPPPPAESDTDPPDDAAEGAESKRHASGGSGDVTGGKEGTLDVAATNRFINANFAQVRTCYERRLKINSLLEGHLDLKIRLTPKGSVGSIRVNSDTVRDAEMLECVMRTIRGWNFPAPDDGWVVFDKSFRFQPTK